MSLLTWSYLMPINFKEVSFRDRLGFNLNPDMIRTDLTMKSNQGYLGQIKDNKGYTMTEQSIDVEIDGKKVLMPLLVPGLNNEEINAIKAGKDGDPILIKSAEDKAIEHGKQRIKEGKSPFFEDKPQSITLESDEVPIGNVGKEVDIDLKTQTKNLLKAKGYTPTAIAGIMGNIDVETGGTFNFQEKQRGGKGYGVFQFDFLNPYYQKYLEKSEKQDSLEAQIDFMHETVYGDEQDIIGRGNAKKLRKGLEEAKTAEEAAETFMNIFEKPGVPHLDRRLEAASKYVSD